jgi:carboxymethylenebutenolidase
MNHFQRYLAEEFAEDFEEGRLPRREAIKLIASVSGSLVFAETILAACSPSSPSATLAPVSPPAVGAAESTPTASASATAPTSPPGTVAPDDPAVRAEDVEFPGEDAQLAGYLARPSAEGTFPAILLCHENRGLTDHIRDVARRLAKAGYVSLAVDLLSRQGGSAAVGEADVPGVLANQPPEQFAADFRAGWQFTGTLPVADAARLGMVGFCFGGGVTWLVATRMPELLAAVPFYGPHPAVAEVPNIRAAVLAIYAGRDDRINQGIPAIEAAMRDHGKVYEKVVYPDVDHAFHNDTGSRYAPEAARDAWARTLAWFDRYVRSG